MIGCRVNFGTWVRQSFNEKIDSTRFRLLAVFTLFKIFVKAPHQSLNTAALAEVLTYLTVFNRKGYC
jgi:hypothetical protein